MQAWRISNLNDVPHFADTVADRGWHAWWVESGVTQAAYRGKLEPLLAGEAIPQGFVAHAGSTYLGSVLLIENDLEVRSRLTPWIAALWVEPFHRGQGVAFDLMAIAMSKAGRLGFEKAYLCAAPKVSPYYLARGWTQIERDVMGLNVFEQHCPKAKP